MDQALVKLCGLFNIYDILHEGDPLGGLLGHAKSQVLATALSLPCHLVAPCNPFPVRIHAWEEIQMAISLDSHLVAAVKTKHNHSMQELCCLSYLCFPG